MGKKTAIFNEGQLVFAKVKGYSPWPAKITKVIAKFKYAVYFYGTGETASVKSEDLDLYDEANIRRFNTERQLKKGDYKEAVDQIQAALAGNDPAPIISDDKVKFDQTLATDDDNSVNESQLHIAEDLATPTPPPAQKKKLAVIKAKHEVSSPLEPAKTKENDEKVSRSGRKIKEKKMNTDEMDPDDMFTQSRKRFKIDDGKMSIAETNHAIEEFRASKMHILQDPAKKSCLDIQYDMIHNVQDIKLALGLEQADVDRSIELLESFKTKILPNITKLMLLKYPNTVDTVKRLRKYVGNLHSWEMEETQVEQFHEKAEAIRAAASLIYDGFKELFAFPDDSSFWTKFAGEQKDFQEKYNTLSAVDLFEGLSYEELDAMVTDRVSTQDERTIPEPEKDQEMKDETVESGNNNNETSQPETEETI